MSFHQKIFISKHAFVTRWEIDKSMFVKRQTFCSKIETMEGMPDVKWYLKCTYSQNGYSFSFCIESQNEISYTINFCGKEYNSIAISISGREFRSCTGTVNGSKEIRNFANYSMGVDAENARFNSQKFIFAVQGFFSYAEKKKNICKLYNIDDEWGSRLKQNNSEDFDIHVDKKIIKIHKLIVAAESPVFAKMFQDNFKEAKENKVTIVDFKNEIVQAAMNYCYRQDISELIKNENDEIDLLYFCDKYDFQTLKPKLEKFLAQKI
uniref:BTB domain-containing protein n=1 Tax=Panagrolaimus sp. ES5 TaxID=591445 RepID=A0AC34G5B0_9BILA